MIAIISIIIGCFVGVLVFAYMGWRGRMATKKRPFLPPLFKGFFNWNLWVWSGVLAKWGRRRIQARYRAFAFLCPDTNELFGTICGATACPYAKEMWKWDIPGWCSYHTEKNFKEVEVCSLTEKLPNPGYCDNYLVTKWFLKEDVPVECCAVHVPPVVPRVSTWMRYENNKIFSSPFFFKGALGLRSDLQGWDEKSFFKVLDYVAENDIANTARVMVFMHEDGYDNIDVVTPHPIDSHGMYDLHTIKPEWEAQVFRRLDYMEERGIRPRYILSDGHAWRQWHSHWLNGDNNYGWNRQKTYLDRYGPTNWVHVLRDPDYGTDDQRARYLATRDYILYMNSWFLDKLRERGYSQPPIIDNNEVESYDFYHHDMAEFFRAQGVDRDYMVTSVMAVDYLKKNSIWKNWIPEIHSIHSLEEYEEAKQWIHEDSDWMPSADGGGEDWILIGVDEAVSIFEKSVEDGNRGYPGNSEGKWSDMNPLIYEIGMGYRDKLYEILGR